MSTAMRYQRGSQVEYPDRIPDEDLLVVAQEWLLSGLKFSTSNGDPGTFVFLCRESGKFHLYPSNIGYELERGVWIKKSISRIT
jgi:hypothetical protein